MHASTPLFLKADLRQLRLSTETFGTKFDVILVDPPWEEYVRRAPGMVSTHTHMHTRTHTHTCVRAHRQAGRRLVVCGH